ncbi:MAG: Ca2+-dependent phosphoinositide-specific phospholipase C [Luteolibacter sp.]|uniref:Ca2+-dependent phosphoinositide-specific phospholipase C n=1 Tax=Luteolibacter sp. TaxID=1962973 RepID=UPI0032637E4F
MKTHWLALGVLISAVGSSIADEDPPMNRVQFIGTHNSYHIAPSPKVRRMIEIAAKGEGDAINHTHRPLTEQLEKLHIRQIELDLYADPKGGLYSDPLAARLAGEVEANPDPAWKEPGLKILHSPDFDFRTTVPTLRKALQELNAWSKAHPKHEPVMVLLELKEDSFSPRIHPLPFDDTQLTSLEAEIRAEMPADRILTPDKVRGDSPSLRDAVTTRGWPSLSAAAGKFLFALDNEGAVRDRYLALSPNKDLRERLLFVSVPPDHPAAAFMKRNDPVGSYDEIRKLVAAGFMVRTRADADLKEVRAKDLSRFKKAVESGAQWISTDAPEELPDFPGYRVGWENGRVWKPTSPP